MELFKSFSHFSDGTGADKFFNDWHSVSTVSRYQKSRKASSEQLEKD